APMLDREETASAAKAGLDLVGDEDRSVFAAEFERAAQIAVVRQIYTFALDRLDDEGRDLTRGERFFQRGKIVVIDLNAIRQQGTEPVTENIVADERKSTVGQAVKGV